MKKIILVLIIISLICPMAYPISLKIKKKKKGSGYYGKIPRINSDFGADKQTKPQGEINAPIILNNDSFNVDKKDMEPSLIDNTQYVDIIVKKDKTSDFVNDLNTLVPILEKLRECIEQDKDIQKFNAIVSNYIDNVNYIERKYKNGPEVNYIAYEQIVSLSQYAKKVAITRTEALTYNKYLSYEEGNDVYSPQNIKKLLENTLSEIEVTLDAIEETR